MKKPIFVVLLFLGITTLNSCDRKICVCYQQVNATMTMTDTYTDNSIACNSLSNNTRTCVEESERLNPDDIAIGKHLPKQ